MWTYKINRTTITGGGVFELIIDSDITLNKISVEHNPGQLLNVVTNFDKFKGFKISKTGSGNKREIEINGKKLASGDYTVTDTSFSTKITLESMLLVPRGTLISV